MPETTHGYVAVERCGCYVAATVDAPQYAKDVAREVAHWIRDGYRVEHVLIEEIRAKLLRCPHRQRTPDPTTRELFPEDADGAA